jgi:hypothetical protein
MTIETFERSLKDSPGRLNGLSGAAHAAQMAGDREGPLLLSSGRETARSLYAYTLTNRAVSAAAMLSSTGTLISGWMAL